MRWSATGRPLRLPKTIKTCRPQMNAKNANKCKATSMCLPAFHWRAFACICGLILLLSACSGNHAANNAQPATDVSAVLPTQQTFHTEVAAFGQLAADSRNALSLSLPQAGQVVATEVLAGRRVKHGEVLLKFEINPTARNAYLQAQNALTVAREGLKRTERLHAQKLATNAQLDAARQTLLDAEAALAAQAKLGGARAVTTLRAPADGVVTALLVQRGQRVTAGTTLVQFAPSSALAAQLGIDPEAAAGVRIGMPVTIHPVYAAQGAPPLHGTIAMVGDAVNPQTHLVDAVATLDRHVALASGTSLSASIATTNFKAWAVPRDALQNDAQGSYLFQIEHGKAKRVDVKVLAPDGSPVGVAGALDPHAPVITLGSYEISDGDPVQAQASSGGSK
ncbi:MAG: efflux RND transporter periplasmic adaptor subunit [Rhodanobacteraceae bacterium]|nr:MAG: efflux RND transporter periplasmic adaptor subunit [Rhodanobacteraceae bacterium]